MEMSAKFDPTASGKSAQQQQHAGASEPATGDVAPKGTAGTGEAICPECEGTGKIEGKVCENCGGSGKIIQGIGGA
jgi:DnaJ-class molecular chaperone